MRKLSNEIKTNGHTYRLIERTSEKAIYSQHDKAGTLVGHEAFRIKIGKEATMPNGAILPERELFPKHADFGLSAWSVGIDRDKAIKRFNEI